MQVPTRAVLRRSPSAAINNSERDRDSGESMAGGSLDGDTGTLGQVRFGSGLAGEPLLGDASHAGEAAGFSRRSVYGALPAARVGRSSHG
jgi:hypothetical protein